jgi:MFS family permease
VYRPKPTFIVGASLLGLMSLGAGFVQNKVGMFILRAISGIGACVLLSQLEFEPNFHPPGGSLTIPSALNLIVQLFPEPQEQGRAIAMFGASGAIGNGTFPLSLRRSA